MANGSALVNTINIDTINDIYSKCENIERHVSNIPQINALNTVPNSRFGCSSSAENPTKMSKPSKEAMTPQNNNNENVPEKSRS